MVGVDPNIQITLETIRDEQLGIITGFYFKCIIDVIPTEEKVYKWLSPPKESINYNIAYEIVKGQPNTCLWFLDGNIYSEWLEQPGFLWIKGKCEFSDKFVKLDVIDSLSSWLR